MKPCSLLCTQNTHSYVEGSNIKPHQWIGTRKRIKHDAKRTCLPGGTDVEILDASFAEHPPIDGYEYVVLVTVKVVG